MQDYAAEEEELSVSSLQAMGSRKVAAAVLNGTANATLAPRTFVFGDTVTDDLDALFQPGTTSLATPANPSASI